MQIREVQVCVLYAELQLLEALGNLVDDLGLDRLAASRQELHVDVLLLSNFQHWLEYD
jgi:hypothetical protein